VLSLVSHLQRLAAGDGGDPGESRGGQRAGRSSRCAARRGSAGHAGLRTIRAGAGSHRAAAGFGGGRRGGSARAAPAIRTRRGYAARCVDLAVHAQPGAAVTHPGAPRCSCSKGATRGRSRPRSMMSLTSDHAVRPVRFRPEIPLRFSRRSIPVLALALLPALAGCKEEAEAAPATEVAPVERRTIVINAEATGVVEPINVVEVKSRASGQITSLPVESGALVEPGDLLVQLDTREMRNNYNQAVADLRASQARFDV